MNLPQFGKTMCVDFTSWVVTTTVACNSFAVFEWKRHTNLWHCKQWRYPFCSFDLGHKKQRPRFRLSFGCASVCWSDIAPTRFIAALTSGWHMTCWFEKRSASHGLARFSPNSIRSRRRWSCRRESGSSAIGGWIDVHMTVALTAAISRRVKNSDKG